MQITVTSEFPTPDANGSYATLNAWFDFHGTGYEQVIKDNVLLGAFSPDGHDHTLTFAKGMTRQTIDVVVPADAKLGLTMARFRISAPGETGLGPDGVLGASAPRAGEVPFGEVEDYQINIRQSPYCFGDAPDGSFTYPSGSGQTYTPTTPYLTKLNEDGPRNRYDYRLHLGAAAQYGDDATINPYNPGPTDPSHDGVTFTTYGSTPGNIILRAGAENQMQVDFRNSWTGAGNAYFSAWIDYDFDGVFEPGEEVVADATVPSNGTIDGSPNQQLRNFIINVPASFAQPVTYLRVRLSDVKGMGPTGVVADQTGGELFSGELAVGGDPVPDAARDAGRPRRPEGASGRASEPSAPEALADLERRAIRAALEHTRGNKTQAAAVLGITRTQLHTRLKRFGLTK